MWIEHLFAALLFAHSKMALKSPYKNVHCETLILSLFGLLNCIQSVWTAVKKHTHVYTSTVTKVSCRFVVAHG